MLNITINKDIPFSLQLVNTDGTFERTAAINLYIYGSDASSLEVSAGPISYNYTTESYTHTMTPSADWLTQDLGIYLATWTVSVTGGNFPDTVTEELNVIVDDETIDDYLTLQHGSGSWQPSAATIDTSAIADAVWDEPAAGHVIAGTFGKLLDTISDDIKRTLGLMHENIYIDNPSYDSDGNLTSARVRIYSDAASVGTGANVIGTYQISSSGSGAGKFTNWEQIKI